MSWAAAVLNGKVHSFCIQNELTKILSFSANKFGLLTQKVILRYNVYVILCFLHSLLKHYCVGVYTRFENLFKTFFYFKLCEMLVSVWFVKYIFLSDFIYNRHRMILKNAVDFIIIVTGWSIKTREKDCKAKRIHTVNPFLSLVLLPLWGF